MSDHMDSAFQSKIRELEAENSTLRDERDHLKAGWASLEQLQADLATAQKEIKRLKTAFTNKSAVSSRNGCEEDRK